MPNAVRHLQIPSSTQDSQTMEEAYQRRSVCNLYFISNSSLRLRFLRFPFRLNRKRRKSASKHTANLIFVSLFLLLVCSIFYSSSNAKFSAFFFRFFPALFLSIKFELRKLVLYCPGHILLHICCLLPSIHFLLSFQLSLL